MRVAGVGLELPWPRIIQNDLSATAVSVFDLLNAAMMKSLIHLQSKSLTSRLLVSVSLLGVLSLAPAVRPAAFLGTAAYAQAAVSSEEVQNYARSLLEIEPVRQDAYNAIKRITGSNEVPPIICNRPGSLNNLNREVRQIAVNYCTRSAQIAASHDLTADRFNAITATLQGDRDLATRIQEAMVQIQRGAARPN